MPNHRPRLADRRRFTYDRARLGARLVTWPGGAFAVGLLLGAGTHLLDTRLPWTVMHVTQASYRSLLTALVAGIITVAVFSIWMRSVLTGMLSAHVSPRILAAHLDDRYQLGIFSGMMGALGMVSALIIAMPTEEAGPIATLTALPLALGLTLLSLVGVLHALNRAVRDLSLQDVTLRLTRLGLEIVERRKHRVATQANPPVRSHEHDPVRGEVVATRMGWVVNVDVAHALRSLPDGAEVRLKRRPGQMVTPGDVLFWTTSDLTDEAEEALRSSVILGRHRLLEDDLAYLVGQMVDLATQALAAGSTDTSTADEVMRGLGLVLARVVETGDPPRVLEFDGRVIVDEAILGVRDIVRDALERLRLASSAKPSAARQLVTMFGEVAAAARRAGRDDVLEDLDEQRDRMLDDVLRSGLSNDVADSLRTQAETHGLGGRG